MSLVDFAVKNGATDAAVETIKESITQIKFANSSASASQNWFETRYNVFVAVKNATAASTFHVLSQQELESCIKQLISAARHSKSSKEYFGLAKGPFRYKPVKDSYDKKLLDYDGSEAAEAAMNAAFKNSRSVAGVFYKKFFDRSVETSSGVSAAEQKTQVQISVRAFNEKNESGHAVSCSRTLKGFHPEEAGKKAGEISKLSRNPLQGKPGKSDVVFDPLAIGNLLARVGEFSTAFNVESGFSCFAGKLNKRVASSVVNISDSDRLENGFNSSMFDDEGVPTKETNIIENGVLKTYLHNTSSARKYKTDTTANAGIIAQRYHNLFLKPGRIKKEKLFSDVRKGLYITNVWYTRFQNYYTGDFSTIPRDGILYIEDGDIVGSLTNIRISDNLLRILMSIAGLSDRAECVQWWDEVNPPVCTPYVLVKDVNITLPTM